MIDFATYFPGVAAVLALVTAVQAVQVCAAIVRMAKLLREPRS